MVLLTLFQALSIWGQSCGVSLNFGEIRQDIIALQRLVIRNFQDNSLLDVLEKLAWHSTSTSRVVLP